MNSLPAFGADGASKSVYQFVLSRLARSEAIRDMVRAQLVEEKLEQGDAEAVGTLTLVYDHHQRELQEKLTDYQHHFLHAIVATLHIHLDAHRCLEVVVLRGKTKKIKKIADGLIAAKGVKHGKLVITTPTTT